jgi:tetratricopeptide (TPR) repeat protein
MVNPYYRDTAIRYYVDDLPSACVPGTRLQNILGCIHLGKPVTQLSVSFLQQQGLEALHRFASGLLPYERFQELASAERAIRLESAVAAKLAREMEDRARDVAMQARMKLAQEQTEAARLTRESDPKYIAKIKNQELRARYGVDIFIEEHCFGRLMNILRSVDTGSRLSDQDYVWLCTVGNAYFSGQLRADYHRLEADFLLGEFKRTRDPWLAVNACSHYRKCRRPSDASALLSSIDVEALKSSKLKAALLTTNGGAFRDLMRWDEALLLGEKAHSINPNDYHPCTLLGAIHMETGNYNFGQEWYAKAVERGATVDSVDKDLRNIFFRADKAKQAEMREFLLNESATRYPWVKQKANTQSPRAEFRK